MNLYAVYFVGYWPVGAVAVTKASSEFEAIKYVWDALPSELKEKNAGEKPTVKLLTENTTILLDGQY